VLYRTHYTSSVSSRIVNVISRDVSQIDCSSHSETSPAGCTAVPASDSLARAALELL